MVAHRPHARVLAAAACGDDEALSALVRLHHDRVYRLRDLEGLTGDETCAVLALEPAAMKTRLRRARAMLRAEIERRGLF